MMAIFLIVTLAAIGVYLLTVSTGQLEAVSQDQQGAKAYQAARTGIEWGAYQLLRNSSCTPSQTLIRQQGLTGYYAEVTCTPLATEPEGGAIIKVYGITATGCNATPCGAANNVPTYVERQLQLTLTQ